MPATTQERRLFAQSAATVLAAKLPGATAAEFVLLGVLGGAVVDAAGFGVSPEDAGRICAELFACGRADRQPA